MFVLIALYLLACLRILNEYECAVVFRLGRVLPEPKGPGMIFLFLPIDGMVRIDLRIVMRVVEPQDVIMRDNVSIKVNAVLYFRVVDPMKSVLQVENFLHATSQVALTTPRSTVGQAELDELLSERDRLNRKLQEIIDGHTEPWGVKVSTVEVKDVDLPERMHRAMARQLQRTAGESHQCRGRISGCGETEAGGSDHDTLSHAPQMRFLQAPAEVATENNSTIVFPLPLDLLKPFLTKHNAESAEPGQ